ncbi:MAG: CPBP family intramembrane metalloprotease [Lachnospiraceae bacterium]|nr:CPBP family intramembrane metalloprotease [Lachnospiraceae bacterium]
MNKFGKFLGCFLPILVALFCQIAISFGFSIVYGIVAGMKMASLGITDAAEQQAYLLESMGSSNVIMLITAIATAATLIIGALWYRAHKPATDFSLRNVVNGKLLLAMACLGLSLQFLISMCLSAVYPILPQNLADQYTELMEQLIGGNIWLSLFVTVILAPLAEELLFRGVTMRKAQKIMPFMAANVLQAVLFGIYHMNWIQGVYAFVLGMILGFTAEYFHSVWASILLHAFVNGSAEVLSLIPEQVTETTAGTVGIAVVGIVLLFVAAKLYPKAKKEPVTVQVQGNNEENELFRENSFDE